MLGIVEKLVKLGPVFFGLLVFAPMWAAALEAADIQLLNTTPNLPLLMIIGGIWGAIAM